VSEWFRETSQDDEDDMKTELSRLSPDAFYFLSHIRHAVSWAQNTPLENGSDECPVVARLLALAESLIELMDSGEFDASHVAYELCMDPETGDPRDLAALLRATDEEMEQAERALIDSVCESDCSTET
jgi:hypothetical protein